MFNFFKDKFVNTRVEPVHVIDRTGIDAYFDSLTCKQLIQYLGHEVKTVTFSSGRQFDVSDLITLKAAMKTDLRERLVNSAGN